MKTKPNFKNLSFDILKLVLMGAAFSIAISVPAMLLPIPEVIENARPANGFMKNPFLFNIAVNSVLVFWLIKRSPYNGFKLFMFVFTPIFIVQTFQTQIETLYFIDAFPLVKGNFEVYKFILKGALEAALFSFLAILINGRLKKGNNLAKYFFINSESLIGKSILLGIVYVILYLLFGYFIAWHSKELRIFYGGPEQLNTFLEQTRNALLEKPEFPFFQFCRGLLWLACLGPIIKAFSGPKWELVLFSGLFLGLMPTAQLAFANPLMPPIVCKYHFYEVLFSNALFGALVAWILPVKNMNT